MFLFLWFFLSGAADTIRRKGCSSDDAGYKTDAATPASGIASAEEHGQVKTEHEERAKDEPERVFFFIFLVNLYF